MIIFEKNKGKLPLSGCGCITEQEVDAIIKQFERDGFNEQEFMFYYGFFAGLGFVCVDEGSETYGIGAREFAENVFDNCFHELVGNRVSEACAKAAQEVLDRYGVQGELTVSGGFESVGDA